MHQKHLFLTIILTFLFGFQFQSLMAQLKGFEYVKVGSEDQLIYTFYKAMHGPKISLYGREEGKAMIGFSVEKVDASHSLSARSSGIFRWYSNPSMDAPIGSNATMVVAPDGLHVRTIHLFPPSIPGSPTDLTSSPPPMIGKNLENRIGAEGVGMLYSRSKISHNWYINKNPQEGKNADMLLSLEGLFVNSPISIRSETLGDKISLYGTRLGANNMFGLGMESGAMYFKSADRYNWYVNKNADGGAGAEMALNQKGLTLTKLNFFDKTLGDKLSLHGSRIGESTMYGLGMEQASMYFKSTDSYRWYINKNADGGLGASMTLNKQGLSVKNRILCEEVQVQLASKWPDYVFSNDYKLMPIEEVENQIKITGHLPGVPSASELESKGLALGEIQVKMMEKLEELTLYLIEQNKIIKELKNENQLLLRQINELREKK